MAIPVTEVMGTPDGRDEVGTPDAAIDECACGVLYRKGGSHNCKIEGEWVDDADRPEEWPEERIQADLEERQRAEAVSGAEGVRADGGEDNVHASRVNAQLAMADGEGEDREPIDVGDHVQDTEDPDATMVVVGLDTLQADAYELGDGGPTVADVNPEHPSNDDVVEVVYPQRTDLELEGKKRYAFPRSRLEVVGRVHERDEGVSE